MFEDSELSQLFLKEDLQTDSIIIQQPQKIWSLFQRKEQFDNVTNFEFNVLVQLEELLLRNPVSWVKLVKKAGKNQNNLNITQALIKKLLLTQENQKIEVILNYLRNVVENSLFSKDDVHFYCKIAFQNKEIIRSSLLIEVQQIFINYFNNIQKYPINYFVMEGKSKGIISTLENFIPFPKGFTFCTNIKPTGQQVSEILSFQNENDILFSITLEGNILFYNCLDFRLELISIQKRQWNILKIDIQSKNEINWIISVQLNYGMIVEFNIEFIKLFLNQQCILTIAQNFVGNLAYILVFKEPISNQELNFQTIQNYIQNEQDLQNLPQLLQSTQKQALFCYTPLTLNKNILYDALHLNNSQIDDSIMVVLNKDAFPIIDTFSFLFFQIKTIKFTQEKENFLQSILELFIIVVPDISEQLLQIDYQRYLAYVFIEMDPNYFNNEVIGLIAQFYQSIPDKNFKNQCLVEFIWPLVKINFPTNDLCTEYFQFIKTIYNYEIYHSCELFGVAEIVKLMLRLINDVQNLPDTILIKCNAFQNLLCGIFQLSITWQDNSSHIANQLFLGRSLQRLISYCTTSYHPYGVSIILQTILSSLNYLETSQVNILFSNFESLSFLIFLFNETKTPEIKVYCLKLFQIILKKNPSINTVDITLCIRNGLAGLPKEFNEYTPLLVQLTQWATDQQVRIKIFESFMCDEMTRITNLPVFYNIVTYFFETSEILKQRVLEQWYTLVRSNRENRMVFLRNQVFMSRFPSFLYQFQDQEDKLKFQIFESGLKLLSYILIYGISLGTIYPLLKVTVNIYKLGNVHTQEISQQQSNAFLRRICHSILHIMINARQDFPLNPILLPEQYQKGITSFMTFILKIITRDEYIIQNSNLFYFTRQCSKYLPKISIKKLRELQIQAEEMKYQWADQQFMPKFLKAIQLIHLSLIEKFSLDEPLEKYITQIQLITPEQKIYFKFIFSGDQADNVNLFNVFMCSLRVFNQYMIAQLEEELCSDIALSLRAANVITICSILTCPDPLKSYQIHLFNMNLHYSLIQSVNDNMPPKVICMTDSKYFEEYLVLQRTIAELKNTIINSLKEYFLCISQTSKWDLASDIYRIKFPDWSYNQHQLRSFMMSSIKDLIPTLAGEASFSLYMQSPQSVELLEKILMLYEPLMIIEKQEQPQFLQVQTLQISDQTLINQIFQKQLNNSKNDLNLYLKEKQKIKEKENEQVFQLLRFLN